jgi:hypothetical protein
MSLPIVIIHQGNPFYLTTCLRHAKVYNPNSTIYLLGDESNRHLADEQIIHEFITDYFTQAEAFAPLYQHYTTNPYHYNLFCFQRWYMLREFMEAKKLERIFVCESDELLYCDVEKESPLPTGADFTILDKSLANSITMSYQGVVSFTDFLTDTYSNQDMHQSLVAQFYSTYFSRNKRVRMGGISDMTLFKLYCGKSENSIVDYAQPVNNCCWDVAIQIPQGFLMEKGIKKITWIDDLPYATYKNGELIRMLGLHFLGGNKMKEYLFMVDDNKKHIDPKSLRGFIFKQWIVKIFNGFKRFPFFARRFFQKLSCAFWRKWYRL